MSKASETSSQRRKLLDEIRSLADIAVFGTLSETYRTCGRAGCHCQQGGPKHGPHLNISYRGEKGKTCAAHAKAIPNEATLGLDVGYRRSVPAVEPDRRCQPEARRQLRPTLSQLSRLVRFVFSFFFPKAESPNKRRLDSSSCWSAAHFACP